MKNLLLASTALVATAGVAAADMSVSGDGRMGLVYQGDFKDSAGNVIVDGGTTLSSRIRIAFSASGETDNGLSFGGSVRADNSGAGASGSAGSVFISGNFGKLSMGDVDGAAKAAVGQVSGVGYTGLNDRNEILYVNSGSDVDGDGTDDTVYPVPSALYEFSTGSTTFYAGIGQIQGDRVAVVPGFLGVDAGQAYSLGIKWSNDNGLTLSAGYEVLSDVFTGVDTGTVDANGDAVFNINDLGNVSQFVLGADYAFNAWTFKGRYGMVDVKNAENVDQYALSVDYATGASTFTGFFREANFKGAGKDRAYGLGYGYDLGGGASALVGWTREELDGFDSVDRADLGVKFSF